jgi:integrase/recombinase XerD
MEQVILKPLYHRQQECIGICFEKNRSLTDIIKKLPAVKWSQTNKCWYTPCKKEYYTNLSKALQNKVILVNNALKVYLQQRAAINPLQQMEVKLPVQECGVKTGTAKMMITHPISKTNLAAFTAFKNMLALKAYSANTIRNYCNEFHHLLRLLGETSVDNLGKQHIMSYLLWLLEKRGYSEMHVHMSINAIKFYFEQVMNREREFYDLPRPKKPFKLPAVLAEEEVIMLIQKIQNIKHRAIIMTGYSAGLRVSEIINLKPNDIDSKRMMIHIRGAKGKKDRMVPLSKKLLEVLRGYYKQYKPKDYLFE